MKNHTKRHLKHKNKNKKDKNSSLKPRKQTSLSWTLRQQSIYLNFLKDNIDSIQTYEKRRELKLFKQISELMKTRTSVQVKSHHQKLTQKFGKVQTIIKKLQEFLLILKSQQPNDQNQSETAKEDKIINEMDENQKLTHYTFYQPSFEAESNFFILFDQRLEDLIQGSIAIDLNEPLI